LTAARAFHERLQHRIANSLLESGSRLRARTSIDSGDESLKIVKNGPCIPDFLDGLQETFQTILKKNVKDSMLTSLLG